VFVQAFHISGAKIGLFQIPDPPKHQPSISVQVLHGGWPGRLEFTGNVGWNLGLIQRLPISFTRQKMVIHRKKTMFQRGF
jgi:hypothetical protein